MVEQIFHKVLELREGRVDLGVIILRKNHILFSYVRNGHDAVSVR